VTAERANQDIGLIGLTSLDEAKLRADLEQGRKPGMIGSPCYVVRLRGNT
jgi:hypothetical protein